MHNALCQKIGQYKQKQRRATSNGSARQSVRTHVKFTILIRDTRRMTLLEKDQILKKFSADPDRYYTVDLFKDSDFIRKSCITCKRFFWTQDASRVHCPDDASDTYSFIGDPPTSKRFDYVQSWDKIKDFFTARNHTAIGRYPVVCRWRDDLYFTIASIVDFQRIMGSKVVFEFPANPLVVPQTCLRFKDLENVGVTGRHFSSFCMVGQHCVPDMDGGYWKDECIQYDYDLLTKGFGIKSEEIIFVEDVWAGGGSFGPSLEYFVRGLELGNAVFTEFQGNLGDHTTLDRRIIDMGAGLERFAWITMGTSTAYDCCFGDRVNQTLRDAIGVDVDSEVLKTYYTGVAKMLDRSDDLLKVREKAMNQAGITPDTSSRMIEPLEGAYLIADHLRTLIFAIADGALPSNVGGGYNLRMMTRRIIERMRKIGMSGTSEIKDLIDAHIDYLGATYPELDARRDDIKTILDIERTRYTESRMQMQKKISKVRRRGAEPDINALVTLYESDGITPEYLVEEGVIRQVPPTFYTRISELHQSGAAKTSDGIDLHGVQDTESMFYTDDPQEFDATVLWSQKGMVALDRTSFYARGGGQEPDHGTIGGHPVEDVQKHAGVILHVMNSGAPAVGERVRCTVDAQRRASITKHHTSTHIINASSRKVLGSWVWQHSAFKDADHARLDITHHSSLTAEQVRDIENVANKMVKDDLPVSIQYMNRGEAEQRYGFSIYQGGVVPVKAVRIVSISDVDVEACGGTHVPSTGHIQKIRITRTKRIQDGVVRLEFVSGEAATKYDQSKKEALDAQRVEERRKDEEHKMRDKSKRDAKQAIPALVQKVSDEISNSTRDVVTAEGMHIIFDANVNVITPAVSVATDTSSTDAHKDGIKDKTGIAVCILADRARDENFHTAMGKEMTKQIPYSVYVGFFETGPATRVVAYAGEAVAASALFDISHMTETAAAILGGGASKGNKRFSQGGGTSSARINDAVGAVESEIKKVISDMRAHAGKTDEKTAQGAM